MDDGIWCRCQGIISNDIHFANNLLSFTVKTINSNDNIHVKIFNAGEELVKTLKSKLTLGDKVYIEGTPRCDAFVNKYHNLVRGIVIIPNKIEFIEHTNMFSFAECEFTSHDTTPVVQIS